MRRDYHDEVHALLGGINLVTREVLEAGQLSEYVFCDLA
jgi:hypothetical protein